MTDNIANLCNALVNLSHSKRAGALRGAGDTRFPLLSSLCGLVFGRIGLAWLFVAVDLSVIWVYCSLAAEYFIKAGLVTWRYLSAAWLK